MQNSMVVFTFSVSEWKYPFWANLVQKIKIISWSWNLVARLIRICRIQWCFFFFCFWVKIFFLGKFGPKSQNCHFKLKFGTYTNSNMQNSMAMFIFFVFDRKCPFSANLVQKVKIISLSWNMAPSQIRRCKIQLYCSLFLFSSGNTVFGQIWSKKSKLSVWVKIWYLH